MEDNTQNILKLKQLAISSMKAIKVILIFSMGLFFGELSQLASISHELTAKAIDEWGAVSEEQKEIADRYKSECFFGKPPEETKLIEITSKEKCAELTNTEPLYNYLENQLPMLDSAVWPLSMVL